MNAHTNYTGSPFLYVRLPTHDIIISSNVIHLNPPFTFLVDNISHNSSPLWTDPGEPGARNQRPNICSLVRLREFTGVYITPAAAAGSKWLQLQLQSSRFPVLKYLLNAPFSFSFFPSLRLNIIFTTCFLEGQQVFRVQAYLFKARDTSKSAILHFQSSSWSGNSRRARWEQWSSHKTAESLMFFNGSLRQRAAPPVPKLSTGYPQFLLIDNPWEFRSLMLLRTKDVLYTLCKSLLLLLG